MELFIIIGLLFNVDVLSRTSLVASLICVAVGWVLTKDVFDCDFVDFHGDVSNDFIENLN